MKSANPLGPVGCGVCCRVRTQKFGHQNAVDPHAGVIRIRDRDIAKACILDHCTIEVDVIEFAAAQIHIVKVAGAQVDILKLRTVQVCVFGELLAAVEVGFHGAHEEDFAVTVDGINWLSGSDSLDDRACVVCAQ